MKQPAMVIAQPSAERMETGLRKMRTETTITTTTLKLPATEYVTPDTTLSSQNVDKLSKNAIVQLAISTKKCHDVARDVAHAQIPAISDNTIIGTSATSAGGATKSIVLNTSSFFVLIGSGFCALLLVLLLLSAAAPLASMSPFFSLSASSASREGSLSLRRRDAYTICNACTKHAAVTATNPRISNESSEADARTMPSTTGTRARSVRVVKRTPNNSHENNVTKKGVDALTVCMNDTGMNFKATLPRMMLPAKSSANTSRSREYVDARSGSMRASVRTNRMNNALSANPVKRCMKVNVSGNWNPKSGRNTNRFRITVAPLNTYHVTMA
mmetsp:Transcript_16549/g.35956  ORF Transcript_16549/g.35956 Transcript_16549/m.35956 type:complete len:329 (+) Transcript_16549:98-1084(+)